LQPGQQPIPPEVRARMFSVAEGLPSAEFSFIYTAGEHEIVSLPDSSPWAERFGGGDRVRLDDVDDDLPGRVHDTRPGRPTQAWGRLPGPGTAEVYVYPGLRGDLVVADVLRKDKGHTEGLEPQVVRWLVMSMVGAPGGKVRRTS
jgi:hypothetical protein